MPSRTGLLALALIALSLGSARAQTTPAAPPPAAPAAAPAAAIDDVVVTGTDDVLGGLVQVSIDAQAGTPVAEINLETVRQQVLELGFFSAVTVTVGQVEGKTRLTIAVVPNPTVGEVAFRGNTSVPAEQLRALLDQQFNIGPDTILNRVRVEESRRLIAQLYRQQVLPFTPGVTVEIGTPASNRVTLTYAIDETAPISRLVVNGATLVPVADIQAALAPVIARGSFDPALYRTAFLAVQRLYGSRGFALAGIVPDETELADGTLNLVIAEPRVTAIDTTALGANAPALSLKVGDYYNATRLLDDVARLAGGRDQQVVPRVERTGPEAVTITLELQDQPAGPITEVRVEGNTVVTDQEIAAALRQKQGDTFNTLLAAEQDFPNLLALYERRGFAIVQQPNFGFRDGVYTLTVRELKVTGYELAWRGPRRTRDLVILRELPEPGGLFNLNALQTGFGNIQRTGVVRDVRPTVRVPDPAKPDEVVVVLELEEAQTGLLQPAIGYSTIEGFSGSFSYTESNLFGLNHTASVNLQAGLNAAGQVLSGGASYTIPWLYYDFLDFKTTRTSVTAFVSSNVTPGNVITGSQPTGPAPIDDPATPVNESERRARSFSTRTTGFGITISRPLLQNLTVSLGYNFQYQANYLESFEGAAYFAGLRCDDNGLNCSYADWNDDAFATARLPGASSTSFIEARGNFSTANSLEFPTGGINAAATVGYGWGAQGQRGLSWSQYTVGARAYLGFGLDASGSFGFGPGRNMALAGRLNTGVILGSAPAGRQFSIGGSGGTEDFTLRGYSFGDLRGDVFYTGSLELRYDFGLKTAVTSGLVGVAFLDFGNAWGNGSRATRDNPDGTISSVGDSIQFGYGLGVQINLGIGSFQLPAIRFDYGFSPYNPGGKFYFRLGYPF